MALRVRHLFGRTITFRFIPAVDGEEHIASSLTSARIYDEKPTAEQVANTASGHLGSEVTSWTLVNHEGTGPAEYEITFPAIEDPDPDSTADFELYYVALNFKAQAGSVSIQTWRQCPLYRERGFTSKIRVSAQEVYDLDQSIEDLARTQLWTEAKIEAAIEDIVSRIEARGYPKDQVFNWEKLNAAARRLACAYCCYDLAGDGNQFWFQKGQLWQERADRMFDAAQFGFDAADDGDPDPSTKVQTGAVAFLR